MEKLTRSKPEVIIAGDYNINLLELAKRNIVNKYFTFITSYNFYPHITLPTRFSRSNATLIDNFLCKSSEVLSSATSGILIDKFSDHQPYFICLKNKKKYNKPQKYITINKLNTENIHKFETELASANLLNSLDHDLDADPETNYNIFEVIIDNHRTERFPNKIIKFNKLKHKQNSCISIGILKSIKFRNDLYRRMRISPPDGEAHNIIAANLHTYNKILRRTIRLAKRNYYHNLFKKYSNNIKQTWTEINIMLNKAKNKVKIPDYFKSDGKKIYDKRETANKFNSFFTNIGPSLTNNIKKVTDKRYSDYLTLKPEVNLNFKPITETVVDKIITNLNSKTSFGHDGISTLVFKSIKNIIIKPLTIIINQTLKKRFFPKKLKIAKVVPIYKAGDNTMFTNYRPISLLPAASKVFERAIHDQLYSYLKTTIYFAKVNMDLEKDIQRN